MIESFRPFIISFIIGFIIGIERERSHPTNTHPIGMRTFVLFALLGTLAAQLNSIGITSAIAVFVFSGILLGYVRTSLLRKDKEMVFIGLTTEMTAGIVFCLGYLANTQPLLAGAIGAMVLLILISKERLHEFARHHIKRNELQAAVIIIFIGIAILPFLPDYTLDPWNLFNPRRLGSLVLLLAMVQFAGYVAIRVFGNRLGTVLMGFCGGLASSTAMFIAMPRLAQQKPQLRYPLIVASIFAVVGMLAKLVGILLVAAPPLIMSIILPILFMIIVGAASGVFLFLEDHASNKLMGEPPANPLDVKSILRLALFIASILILSSLAQRYLGNHGIEYVTFIGALFELHGVSLSIATLYLQHTLTLAQASYILMIAIAASFASKFALLWIFSHNRYAIIVSLLLILMCAVGLIGYRL